MRLTRHIAWWIGALPAMALAAEPAPLKLMVGDMPPYAIASAAATTAPGSLVEIAQELGRRVGSPVEVQFYPWSRAVVMVSLAPRTLVLPITRTEEREHKYRWLAKIYKQRLIFVGQHGNRKLADPALLTQSRLAVLRGTPYKQLLLDAGYTDVAECATIKECVRMVKTGIADASFGAEDTHRTAASTGGNKSTDFDYSPPFRHSEVWLAGSLDISEEEARKWRTTLDTMRTDGSFARILHKYNATGN